MNKLTLLNDIPLEIQVINDIEYVNLLTVVKAMGSTNPTRDLTNFFTSPAYDYWTNDPTDPTASSRVGESFESPSDNGKYYTLCSLEGLQFYLMYSNATAALEWKRHLIQKVLPEWASLKQREQALISSLYELPLEEAIELALQNNIDPEKTPMHIEYRLQGFYPLTDCCDILFQEYGVPTAETRKYIKNNKVPTLQTRRSMEKYRSAWVTYDLQFLKDNVANIREDKEPPHDEGWLAEGWAQRP